MPLVRSLLHRRTSIAGFDIGVACGAQHKLLFRRSILTAALVALSPPTWAAADATGPSSTASASNQGSASSAEAAPGTRTPRSEAEKETARGLMDEGDALAAQSDWEMALKHYRAAHQIMRVPTTGIEVARAQAKLGQLVEARTTAIEVANLPLMGKEPAVFTQAREAAAELADELESRIPSVVIEVEPREVAPRVRIDEAELPLAALGLPFRVNPGQHQVTASAPGYSPVEMEFTVAESERRSVPLTLVLDPSRDLASAGAQGNTLESNDGAAPSPEGSQDVGFESGVSSGTDAATTRGFIALGVAGAAGLVGGGAGIYSLMKVNEAQDNHCTGSSCSSSARPLLDQATTSAWIANVGVGVAAVALVYGIYELAVNAPTQSAGRTTDRTRGSSARAGKGHTNTTESHTAVSVTSHQSGATLWWSGAF